MIAHRQIFTNMLRDWKGVQRHNFLLQKVGNESHDLTDVVNIYYERKLFKIKNNVFCGGTILCFFMYRDWLVRFSNRGLKCILRIVQGLLRQVTHI